jgi:sarcosine oxidase, subunit gamma
VSTSNPAIAVRRSALRQTLLQAGFQIECVGDVEIVRGGPPVAGGPTVADLSSCDRWGLKGPNSAQWLAAQGVPLPDRPNRLLCREDGLIIGRYGINEFMLATVVHTSCNAIDALRQTLTHARPAGCYPVPRVDGQAALGLQGEGWIDLLAGLCAADLRPRAFGPGDVLQTRCAGVGVQLLHLPSADVPRGLVLLDASYATHLWSELLGAARHAGGGCAPQSAWLTGLAAD